MGVLPSVAWDMTPREFYEYGMGFYKARNALMKWSREDAITSAWYSAALGRTSPKKSLEPLSKILSRAFPERRKAWGPDAILGALRGIVSRMGGTDNTLKD